MPDIIPFEIITGRILMIHGRKVLIDRDLAELYGVETKRLKEQVRRNKSRFPEDFMFELSENEEALLRSQNATLKGKGRHSKYLSFAFTEQGVAMLSGVLNSKRAIAVNIAIMRAFVKMRELLAVNKEFSEKLQAMEAHLAEHDEQILLVFDAIKQLLAEEEKPKRQIGF